MKVADIIHNNTVWMPSSDYEQGAPTISVLLPTFSRGKSGFFKNAVESVIRQTMRDLELIVIDDASTDETYDQIREFMAFDRRISCIRHKNNIGLPAVSEYEGYLRARGEYIAFIFDDVEWKVASLESLFKVMRELELKCAFGKLLARNNQQNLEQGIELGGPGAGSIIDNLESHNFIGNAGVILHRDVIEDVGLYDPHISLVRVCDWDLWRRVKKRYNFPGLDILMGYENGALLSDSISLTFRIDHWTLCERMRMKRNEKLRPDRFAEMDVFELLESDSEYFRAAIKELAQQYSTKHWYMNIGADNWIRKKKANVLVAAQAYIDASICLCFERLTPDIANIRIVTVMSCPIEEITGACCLIVVRHIEFFQEWVEYAKKLNIPVYYFIDDNFIELASSHEGLSLYTKENFKKWLKEYDGVLASTEELGSYFMRNELHDNVLYYPPIIGYMYFSCKQEICPTGEVNVAFIGGEFRVSSLVYTVWPAIIRIAKVKRVNFFCPDYEELRNMISENDNVTINYIPYTTSLDQMLIRYGSHHIHMVVHAGPVIENNKYKTINALLNASQLGAVLIVPDRPPFNALPDCDRLLLRVPRDEVHAWSSAMSALLDDEKRNKIVSNAREFCAREYGGQKNEAALRSILEDVQEVGYITRMLNTERVQFKNQPKQSRDSFDTDERVVPSPLMRKVLNYEIHPKTNSFSSIEVKVATHARPTTGVLRMELYCVNNPKIPLRISRVQLEYIVDNHMVTFNFERITNCLNNKLLVRFTIENSVPKARLSFYETFEEISQHLVTSRFINRLRHYRTNLYYLIDSHVSG